MEKQKNKLKIFILFVIPLIIILLFTFTFNLLFTINFDNLKNLSIKEKILYAFNYPTKLIEVKKDSEDALILISAFQKRFEMLKAYFTGSKKEEKKPKKVRTPEINFQNEKLAILQAISKRGNVVILREDGTVAASGNNDYGQCDVSNWKDIVEIGVGTAHTVGLKSNGTVIAIGNNDYGQCDVSKWKHIISVGAGNFHTVGLKEDGTVVATGNNDFGQCNVSKWKHIVQIKIDENFSIGLQSNSNELLVGKRTVVK